MRCVRLSCQESECGRIREFTDTRTVLDDYRCSTEVAGGDFDAPPEAASMRFWHWRQSLNSISVCYADAWRGVHADTPGHTFTPRNPLVASGEMPLERGRRIDYILVRCSDHGPSLEVAGCMLAFDVPVNDTWASDHFGVVADLIVPTPASMLSF